MKGIILAAGRGSRMGALTAEAPKCLTRLKGVPLLDRQLASIRAAGVMEVAIVTGYQKRMLEPFVPRTFENPRWQETNMVMSLCTAADWLRTDRCVVSYSDIFYEPSAVASLAQTPHDICITYDANWLSLWRRRFADPLSDAETFRLNVDNTVAAIGGKAASLEDIRGQYMGLLAFSPRGWKAVEDLLADLEPAQRDRQDMTGMLARLIAKDVPVHAVSYSGQWGEVDSADDLAVYEAMAARGELTLQEI